MYYKDGKIPEENLTHTIWKISLRDLRVELFVILIIISPHVQ